MTRKHFKALADSLRANAPDQDSNCYEPESLLFENIINSVAHACARANPSFNYKRFTKASGLAAIKDHRDTEMRLMCAA